MVPVQKHILTGMLVKNGNRTVKSELRYWQLGETWYYKFTLGGKVESEGMLDYPPALHGRGKELIFADARRYPSLYVTYNLKNGVFIYKENTSTISEKELAASMTEMVSEM